MSNLSIWVGNTEVIPYKEPEPGDNFSTCEHRSKEKQTKTRKLCCGNSTSVSGYVCSKRGIFNIEPKVCDICPVYVKRT